MTLKHRLFATGLLILGLDIAVVAVWRLSSGTGSVLTVDDRRTKGDPQAKVVLTEFSDFHCLYCFKLQPTLKSVLAEFPHDVKLVFKYFPIFPKFQSEKGAEAAECAADQNRFWDYHDVLFNEGWDPDKNVVDQLVAHAGKTGLDTVAFRQCLESGEKKAVVERDKAEGKAVFVSGTPTLILNSTKILTKYGHDDLVREIKKALGEVRQ
jgi:protein-disulfide isomerase